MLMRVAAMDASLGSGGEGLSVGVAMDVFHALVAVVAQGSVVVVGEEPDELIGAVLCRGKEPQGRAPCLCVAQVSLSGLTVGDQGGDGLGQGGTFLLLAGGDAQDLLSVVEANIPLRHAPLQQAPLSALGLLAIAEQHREVAGGSCPSTGVNDDGRRFPSKPRKLTKEDPRPCPVEYLPPIGSVPRSTPCSLRSVTWSRCWKRSPVLAPGCSSRAPWRPRWPSSWAVPATSAPPPLPRPGRDTATATARPRSRPRPGR